MRIVAILIYRLLRWAVVRRRPADFIIGGAQPYMRRWYVIPRNKRFNIYLHQILRDDDDRAVHDHPWRSWSLTLHGHLGEVYRTAHGRDGARLFRTGSFVRRDAHFAHRLFMPIPGRQAWTLFVTGPVVRDWGFHCPQGWRHHTMFTSPVDSGQIGRGCE